MADTTDRSAEALMDLAAAASPAEYERRHKALKRISPDGDSAHWERTVRAAASAGISLADILDWSDGAEIEHLDSHRRAHHIVSTNRQMAGAGALFNLAGGPETPPVAYLEAVRPPGAPAPQEQAQRRPWRVPGHEVSSDGTPWPALVKRDDGATVIYADALTWIHGEPGCGKSWLGLIFADSADRAILVDWEASPRIAGERANLLGTSAVVQNEEQFAYCHGTDLFDPGPDGDYPNRTEAEDWISRAGTGGVVILDAASSGGCPADGDEVYTWLQRHVAPFRRRGVAVVVVDHVPKRKEGRPDGAIGSFGKEAAPDLSLRIIGQPWNATSDGHVTLVVSKDRFGHLPATKGHPAATVFGTWRDGGFSWRLAVPLDAPKEAQLRDRIVAALREAAPVALSQNEIVKLVGGRGETTRQTIKTMAEGGDAVLDYVSGEGYFVRGDL